MKKIILWLDMYRMTILEYFNALKNHPKAVSVAYKNDEVAEAYDIYLEAPSGLEVYGEISVTDEVTIIQGQEIRIPYLVEGNYASQYVTFYNPDGNVTARAQNGYIYISSVKFGNWLLFVFSGDQEYTAEIDVHVVHPGT